ncbi:MAG: hypothetical protein FWJ93_10885 [Micromonosporaceae bacterium]
MCVLCYELADEEHWADAVAAGPDGQGRVRARHRRLRILTAVLSRYGLTVSDPGVGRHVVVADRKGAAEMAAGLPAVWRTAERLAGRRIDPLDRALLDALSGEEAAA